MPSKLQSENCVLAVGVTSKIFIVIFLCLFPTVKAVDAGSPIYEVEDLRGEWVSSQKHVNITLYESADNNGLPTLRIDVVNTSNFVTVDFFLETRLNLSENHFVLFEVRIREAGISLPLGIVLFDDGEKTRGFGNIVERYGLSEMDWGTIALDPEKSAWEDEDFDSSSVTRIRFNSYNEDEPYSQTIWIRNSRLVEYQAYTIPSSSIGSLTNIRYFLSILFLVFISFVIGSLVFRAVGLRFPPDLNSVLRWPFCAAFGLSFLTLVLFLVSPFNLSKAVFIVVVASSLSLFVINIARDFRNSRFNGLSKCIFKRESLFPIFVYILSIVAFSYLAIHIYWPIPGDAYSYGKIVGIVSQNERIPFGLIDIIQVPMGFNTLSTFSLSITDLYPGQTILIVATVIVIILSCMIFSAMYFCTGSLEFSVVGYSLLYFLPESGVPMWMPSHNFLVGKYLPCVYSNLLGELFFITFVSLQCFYMRNKSLFTNVVISVLLLFSLLVTYFPLVPILVFFLALKFLLATKNRSKEFYICKTLLIIFLIVLYLCFSVLGPVIKSVLNVDVTLRYDQLLKYRLLEIDSPYFRYAIIAFLTLPISMWIATKKEELKDWAVAYFTLLLPMIFSFHEQIYTDFLWFLRPDRLLILLIAVCYFVLLIGIHRLFRKEQCPLMKINFIGRLFSRISEKGLNRYSKMIVAILLTSVSVVYLFLVCTSVDRHFNVYYNSKIPSGNDFLAMEWLADNAYPDEVILNDRTWSAIWLPSFKALDVINERDLLRGTYLFGTLNGTLLANRTVEVNKILAYPWNHKLTDRIVDEYNISYVYISDSARQFRHLGRGEYLPDFPWAGLTQKERILIYLMNPRLELVFQSGDATIFKVKKIG